MVERERGRREERESGKGGRLTWCGAKGRSKVGGVGEGGEERDKEYDGEG